MKWFDEIELHSLLSKIQDFESCINISIMIWCFVNLLQIKCWRLLFWVNCKHFLVHQQDLVIAIAIAISQFVLTFNTAFNLDRNNKKLLYFWLGFLVFNGTAFDSAQSDFHVTLDWIKNTWSENSSVSVKWLFLFSLKHTQASNSFWQWTIRFSLYFGLKQRSVVKINLCLSNDSVATFLTVKLNYQIFTLLWNEKTDEKLKSNVKSGGFKDFELFWLQIKQKCLNKYFYLIFPYKKWWTETKCEIVWFRWKDNYS